MWEEPESLFLTQEASTGQGEREAEMKGTKWDELSIMRRWSFTLEVESSGKVVGGARARSSLQVPAGLAARKLL